MATSPPTTHTCIVCQKIIMNTLTGGVGPGRVGFVRVRVWVKGVGLKRLTNINHFDVSIARVSREPIGRHNNPISLF